MAFVPWLPSASSPAIWLDASNDQRLSLSGAGVAWWQNQGSLSAIFEQAGDSSRPSRIDAELNGLPVIRFDGINDHLGLEGGANLLRSRGSAIVMAVARFAASPASEQYILGISRNTAFARATLSAGAASGGRLRAGGRRLDEGNYQYVDSVAGVGSDWLIACAVLDWENAALYQYINATIDGFTTAFHSAGLTSDTNSYRTRIGSAVADAPAAFFAGDIAEIIVIEDDISSETRELLEGYLSWKWGLDALLPAEHPYKMQAPGEYGYGLVTGVLNVGGNPAERDVIAISYEKQEISDGAGGTQEGRVIVGETRSLSDGSYSLTLDYIRDVIVLALDNYGEAWRPNQEYVVGQRIRPTKGAETGYGYDITIAGNSGETEPTWWVPEGGSDTGQIGTATAQAQPLWWSVAHAPIQPDVVEPEEPAP